MQASSHAPHRFRSLLPVALAALAACANASYDYDAAALDSEGGSPGVAGSGVAAGGAGSPGVAGTPGSAGSGMAGRSAAGGSSSGGSGAAGSPSSGGTTAMGGSGQAGSAQGGTVGSAGSTSGKCTAKAWSAGTVYMMGDKATKGGKEYTAAYYTMADPETHCCGNGAEWASSVSCQ